MKKMVAMVTAALAVGAAWADTEKVGGYTWTYRINGDTAEIYGHSEMTYEEDIWSDPTYRFSLPFRPRQKVP